MDTFSILSEYKRVGYIFGVAHNVQEWQLSPVFSVTALLVLCAKKKR